MGVPVVSPSNTPDRIFTASASWRWEVWREVPVRRRSTSGWMSASDSSMSGGQPSTMQPSASPWLSPKLVTLKSLPKVLPDTGLPFLRLAERAQLIRLQQEHFRVAALELEPGEGHVGISLLQGPTAVAHFHHQDAVLREIAAGAGQDAAYDVEAVIAGREPQSR